MEGAGMEVDTRLEGHAYAPNPFTNFMTSADAEHELGYNPQINCGYDPQLRDDRRQTKDRLRRRFEHIYEKYGRDFEGIADEIDLSTGEIVVDNGHLQHMQHEADVGVKESAESELQDASDGIYGGDGAEYDADSDEEGSSLEGAGDRTFSSGDSTVDSATSLFGADESAQEDSCIHNEADMGATTPAKDRLQRRERSLTEASNGSAATSDHDDADIGATDNILDRVPGLKESMMSLQAQYKSGQALDQDAIQALGMSIANQLASFVSGGGQQTSKKQPKKTTDITRGCSEPFSEPPAKRQRRLPSPLSGASPAGKSLWAPLKLPRQQTRKRKKHWKASLAVERVGPSEPIQSIAHSDLEDAPNIPSSLEEIQDDQVRACSHCDSNDSPIWRKGPDGLLCNTCGMYFYRYGSLRSLNVPDTEAIRVALESDGDMDPLLRDWLDYEESDKKRRTRTVGVQNARFTPEEDALIIKLKEIESFSWETMVVYFPGRSAYSLQCRYSKKLQHQAQDVRDVLLSQGYKGTMDPDGITVFSYTHEPFTDAEDELLLKLRDEHGMDWDEIASSFEARSPIALEQRYLHLENELLDGARSESDLTDRPRSREGSEPLRHPRYTYEEDSTIVKLREVDKVTWENMAELLPGRHASSLQKRYIRELCGRHPDSVLPSRKAYDHDIDNLQYARPQSAPPDTQRAEEPSWKETNITPDPGVDTNSVRQLDNGDMESMHQIFERKAATRDSFENVSHHAIINSSLPGIVQPFTENDDRLILKLREQDNLPWPIIAEQFPGRTVPSISDRYYHHLLPEKARALEAFVSGSAMPASSDLFPDVWTLHHSDGDESVGNKRWTARETDILVMLREQRKSWKEIADRLPGRTARAVEGHYAMVFGRTKKRKSVPAVNGSSAPAPLLRRAVKNSRRRSESAATVENSNGAQATPESAEAPAPIRPRYKLLLPNPFPKDLPEKESVSATKPRAARVRGAKAPTQASANAVSSPLEAINNAKTHSNKAATHKSPSPLPKKRSDNPLVELKTPRADTFNLLSLPPSDFGIARDSESSNNPSLETPARLPHGMPIYDELVSTTTANYDTPARFNPQNHPYFIKPKTPYQSPTAPNLGLQFNDDQHMEGEEFALAKESLKATKKRAGRKSAAKQSARKTALAKRRPGRRRKATRIAETTDDDNNDEWKAGMASDEDEMSDAGGTTDEDMRGEFEEYQDSADLQLRWEQKAVDSSSNAAVHKETADPDSGNAPANTTDNAIQAQDEEIKDIQPPPHSFVELVTMALKSKSPMTTAQIYNWLENEFEWCRCNTTWRARVRVVLSGNPRFDKVDKLSKRHNNPWVISDAPSTVSAKAKKGRKRSRAHDDTEEVPTQAENEQKGSSSGTPAKKLPSQASKRPRGRPRKVRNPPQEKAVSSPPNDHEDHVDLQDVANPPEAVAAPTTSEQDIVPGVVDVQSDGINGPPSYEASSSGQRLRQDADSPEPRMEETPVKRPKRLRSTDVIRDSESVSSSIDAHDSAQGEQRALPDITPDTMSQSSHSSSSPILTKQAAPPITYKAVSTPRDTGSSMFRNMHKRGSQGGVSPPISEPTGAASSRSRAGSVFTESGRRRVVYTPARKVDGSEDELA